ncbi:MAG: hypothetical protein KAT75_10330 [Dehalococcoidia bacterium]|nr:hypothetical protein [Dehalococcoidia bacterium]
MNFKHMAIVGSVAALFLLGGCASGVSQEEYDALKAQLETTKAELAAAQNELAAEQAKLDAAQANVQDCQSKLAQAHAYAEVFDVTFDPARFALGVPTKYGFVGYGKSPDYISSYVAKAEATGDAEFAEMVAFAFSLPWGEKKDKRGNEVYVHWADRWLGVTEP